MTFASAAAAPAAAERAEAALLTTPAYDRPWQIRSFALHASLTHQRIFDIAFETNGTVWLATDGGLRRYNGYSWQLYDENSGLPSSFVRAVWVTAAGELWVGTDKGAGVFDPQRNRYETRGSEKGLAGPNVRHISEDPDGTLWFACDQWPDISTGQGGLTSMRDGNWQTYGSQHGMPLDYVIGRFRDSIGREFAMTPRGWVQRKGEKWAAPQNRGYEAEECILHMAEGPNGALFAQGERSMLVLTNRQWKVADSGTVLVNSTRNGEVVALRWDRTRGTIRFDLWDGRSFVPASSSVPVPPGARFYRLRQSPDGSIWCVGYGTVIQWNYRVGQWTFYPNLPPPLMIDQDERVWFSGGSNVVVLQDRTLRHVPQLRQVLGANEGGSVLGVLSDSGSLGFVRPNNPAQPRPAECGVATVKHALTDADGRLWVLGYDAENRIVITRREGEKWATLSSPDLQNKRIGSAAVDPRHGVWLVVHPTESMDYQLIHAVDDRLEWQTFSGGRPPLTYPNFFIALDQWWMLGYAGLHRKGMGPNETWQSVERFRDTGVSQAAAGAGDLLFIVPGARAGEPGCALYSDGQWQFRNGDFERACVGRDRKTFFLTSRGGVYIRRVPGTLDLRFLALPENAVVGSVVQDHAGGLWMGTSEGVYHYRPGVSAPNTMIRASLTEVKKNGTLPVSFQGVRRFSTDDSPEAFRYSWRFDGGSWSRFDGPEQILPLPPLSSGQHHLEVRACDPDDNVDPTPAVLDFAVLDVPLQQRAWFKPAVALLVLLIIYLSWIGITRTRQIARSNLALREEVAVRRKAEEELQKAHDELERRVAERTAELSRANESLSREIIERKQAEATQRQLEDQLRQSQKMEAIGTLAGGIAHDFNNILTVIIPYTQLALEEIWSQASAREKLKRVLVAADRARNLIDQILAFSRHQKQQRRVVDLTPLVKETVKLLRPAFPATIRIKLDLEPGTPPVFADPTQIHQVLMNLCTNAEHAMRGRSGGVLEIRLGQVVADETMACLHPDLKRGRYVKLSVRDNGKGMDEETQRRIFDPFFTTKGPGEGSGLGLAVVHGIVKEHEGIIALQSQPGAGACFDVYLPLHQKEVADSDGKPTSARSPLGQGEHILLVDDEPAVGDVLEAVLTRVGYRVTTHTDPMAALDQFCSSPHQYDLIFTDLTMPGMTGIDLAQRVRKIRPQLPILLATGFGGAWENKAEELGIHKIIQKPADLNSIGSVVHEALRANGARAVESLKS